MQQDSRERWLEELGERGYTIRQCGGGASPRDLAAAIGEVIRAAGSTCDGEYNGGGGVERARIGDSDLLDAREGAPRELHIQFHNEMAYSNRFPRFVAFAMTMRGADGVGGQTTLCDNLELVTHLPNATLLKMRTLGVLYVRRLLHVRHRGEPEFFTAWQESFQTDSLDEALRKGNEPVNSMLTVGDDGATLTHTVWCPLFQSQHPVHGETLFGSILNRHGSWQDGHAVFGRLDNSHRPYHLLWGDGTELTPDELTELRHAHAVCTTKVIMNQGDVIIIDNLRVQHGRTPYTGVRALGLVLSELIHREPQSPSPAFRKIKRAATPPPAKL